MSIVTLKKKTATQYHSMSVGTKTGFSLNGTHRSQGYVGQTMLSRSLPRTLAKGTTPKGHGGCCGKFIVQQPILSAVTSTEDSNVIKSSVLDNTGMLATKYRWIRRPQPFTSVKADDTLNSNTQQEYINHINNKTLQAYDSCQDNTKICNPVAAATCNGIVSKKQNNFLFNFTKPQRGPKFIPQSQSTYISKIKCTDPYTQTSKTNHPPFACGFMPVNHCPPPGGIDPATCKFPRSNK